jgi:hypothetical protein
MSVTLYRLRRGFPRLRLCLCLSCIGLGRICLRLSGSLLVFLLRTVVVSRLCPLVDTPIANVQAALESRLLPREIRTQNKAGDGARYRGN